ncbi:MAG: hypothetical protein JWM14_3458 [Chitinophagaceae bacterium]|nr:hypothetical protein [Chitinophagaceae bacterium]
MRIHNVFFHCFWWHLFLLLLFFWVSKRKVKDGMKTKRPICVIHKPAFSYIKMKFMDLCYQESATSLCILYHRIRSSH